MTVVVASAFLKALAGLVLCFGLSAVLFTVMERSGGWTAFGEFPTSPWDIPIALGIAAASVLVAALIYPARRPLPRLRPHGRDRGVASDLRVLHR